MARFGNPSDMTFKLEHVPYSDAFGFYSYVF